MVSAGQLNGVAEEGPGGTGSSNPVQSMSSEGIPEPCPDHHLCKRNGHFSSAVICFWSEFFSTKGWGHLSLPFHSELIIRGVSALVPLPEEQASLCRASPPVHIWSLAGWCDSGTPEHSGLLPPPAGSPLPLAGSCYLGTFSSILPHGQPSIKQPAIKGFVCGCWLRKNHRKNTLEVSSETVEGSRSAAAALAPETEGALGGDQYRDA